MPQRNTGGEGGSVYYHAGPRGLREILPPIVTGAPSVASYGAGVCRRDKVYVTTSLVAAIGIASLVPPHGRGVVYEVDPLNPTPDPDCTLPGLSFEADRAKIIRAVSVRGKDLKRARTVWSQP